MAAKVTEGTKEKKLPPTKTFRIALNGYYLFYSVINGRVLLVKAEKIHLTTNLPCGRRRIETAQP